MSSEINDTQANDAIRALLSSTLGTREELDTNIDANDQMFNFIAARRGSELLARSEYLTSGMQLLAVLEQLVNWKFGSFERVESLLDFASGYGRLTRFLVHRMPSDRIWVSDIQPGAVAFQEAEFCVNGFVSADDPTDLSCDKKFDCIFVASLFSHLPPATFVKWLEKLCSLLKPGGLLAFTVLDASGLAAGESMPDAGIWFSEGSEISSLDTQDYGRTIVTEGYVRKAIKSATGRPECHRIPYGLLYHQDIYLVVNEQLPDFSSLKFTYLPHGAVDFALWAKQGDASERSGLYLRGWALCKSDGGSAVEVQVLIEGQLEQALTPSIPRPDVSEHLRDSSYLYSGWECRHLALSDDLNRIIEIKAISPSGVEAILYLGPISALLPMGKAESCLLIREHELYVKGWAAEPFELGLPVEVEITVNGQQRQKVTPSIYRPELFDYFKDDRFLRAGWECSCLLERAYAGQEIEVKMFSGNGVERILYKGTIASLEAQGDVALGQQREALLRLQADLHERLEYIRHLEAEVARKNAALESFERHVRRWPWQRRTQPHR